MLSSSFDSLGSLNVYMSLPRQLTCLFFVLLLVTAICGAQGRAWKIRHTCLTYISRSKTGSKEKNKSYNQIKMCTCMDCGGWNGSSFCMISLSLDINSFESMAIFLYVFSWTFMCPYFFLFSILGPSCVHIFFSISHASLFLIIARERDQHNL